MPTREDDVEETVSPSVNVTVLPIKTESEVSDSFTLPAVVEPNRVTSVSAEIAGRIESITCKKGQTVHVDDVLLSLNTDLLIPQYNTAKAQYERDCLEWERMKDLVEKRATAQRDLDDTATRMAISKATLDQIGATLDRSRIVAPADGIINDLPVERGEYVDPGEPVAQLVDTTLVKVAVDLPEKDVPFFRVGQKADIVASLRDNDKTFSGAITFISAVADEQTRSTRVEITLPNPDNVLHSGQIVMVRLTRQTFQNTILIPLLAVIPMESGKVVYIVEDNQAVRRDVGLGVIKGDRIQVLRGLNVGDQLIVEGHRFVAPGLKVTIIPEKP
ncbi:MAG: efflux RND transporter periplasmic adaptor subunit [Phycisphaerae bacterium]|nr:efflux RND transporter periplasmic adaptor subunit [Phycisphaerae bacterium]